MISWYNTAIKDEAGQIIGTLSSGEDVTERKQAEEKIEQYTNNLEQLVAEREEKLKSSERLAAIGATAGMVGHDIRNPLQAIMGDLYLLREEMKEIPNSAKRQAMEESLDEIEKNLSYINKIVSDLQDFTRVLTPVPEEVSIDDLINSTLCSSSNPRKSTKTNNCRKQSC